MKILIVSYYDDNFGDVLIRTCFEKILRVVLKNQKIDDFEISKMSLKDIDEKLIKKSNIIFFAGGGLFGLSYLNFFDYLDKITKIAEKENIPVIYSSMGINNMDADSKTEKKLIKLLKRKSIKAISVRENISLFKKYAKGCKFPIVEVCDPGVWTKYVYNLKKDKHKNKLIGINVVRGGLFKDNNKSWTLGDEEKYLLGLKERLDELGYDYYFYTNGSFLDDNSLRYFVNKYNIPEDKVIYNNTTKEFVYNMRNFDFVASIRMHSSIVAYSMSIPSFSLVWNDKIPLFYQKVGLGDRLLLLEDEKKIDKIIAGIEEKTKTYLDKKYMMSLYEFLFDITRKYLKANDSQIYDFNEVCSVMKEIDVCDTDEDDLRFKLSRGMRYYTLRFTELKELKDENKNLVKELNVIKDKYEKEHNELQKLRNRFIVRLDNKIKRTHIYRKIYLKMRKK